MEQISTQIQSTLFETAPRLLATDFGTFLASILALWGARVLIVKGLVALGRSSYAEQFRITKRPLITEAQIERESVWVFGFFYDFVAFLLAYYAGFFHDMPLFASDSFTWYFIFHATVVEFIYYWFHRFLHVSWIYKTFHQYHHKSINTEPTTGLSFEIVERLSYTFLFAIAPLSVSLTGHQCYAMLLGYYIWFDIMNEGGHINFECLPDWYHNSPLKYVFYSPTFHSVHHTKFKKNFSLFMPWTDMMFGTAIHKESSQELLPSHIKPEKKIDFVLLVHPGYMPSIFYSSKYFPRMVSVMKCQHKYTHKPWMYLLYPFLAAFTAYMGYFGLPSGYHNEEEFEFNVPATKSNPTPRSVMGSTWIVQNIGAHYLMPSVKKTICNRIEEATLEAQKQGIKVVGLGNFNKAEWINHGGLDIVKNLGEKLNSTYISHGDTLSAATVYQYSLWLREQKYWRKSVFITGATSKIGRALCLQLIKNDITVYMYSQVRARYQEIANEAPPELRHLLIYSDTLADGKNCDLWLTGKMVPHGKELLNAIPQNATIVNFAVPDPLTPKLMATRPDLLHLDSGLLSYDSNVMSPKFTWLLPSGSIYACLGGCIVHAVLGIQAHEVGPVIIEDMDKYWSAALELGFKIPPHSSFYVPITLPSPRVL